MLKLSFRRIVILALFAVLACVGTANAEIVSKDTVWAGDVFVDDKVIVDEGATLLIVPGTKVSFRPMPAEAKKGGGRLIIFGRLIAQGTPDAPILFTSSAASPRPGDWEGLRFEETDQKFSRIDHSIIEYARAGINGRSSYLQVENTRLKSNQIGLIARNQLRGGLFGCIVSENTIGVKFEQNDQLRIVGSRIESNRDSGVVYSNSSPIIQHSQVSDNGKYGISCQRSSSPLIENNLVSGHEIGVHAEMMSSPTILHNELESNEVAISLQRISFAVIENNRIRQNSTGIYCNLGAYPHIHRNNIVDNRDFAIDLGTYMSIVVARNPPFDARAAMNLSIPDNKQSETVANNDANIHFPSEGVIDAYGNWWGQGSLKQLRSNKPNKDLFEDGHDKADVFYRDKTYPRDRIGYAGWFEQELGLARRKPVKLSGIKGQVFLNEGPVPGVRIFVYRNDDNAFDTEGVTFSSPTGIDGAYELPLAPGHYRLVARNFMPQSVLQTSKPESPQRLVSVKTITVNAESFAEEDFLMREGVLAN